MNSESVWSDAAYSMSWPAFQPKARTEKLSRPSLMFRFRAAGEDAVSAGEAGKTASPAAAAAADRRKARRVVWELVEFMFRWWSSRFPLALPTGMIFWPRQLRPHRRRPVAFELHPDGAARLTFEGNRFY